MPDLTSCATSSIANGYCMQGVCVNAVCGDGAVQSGEVCDDGNVFAGDGCSAYCDSIEVCGNDVADLAVGEECDGGIYGLSGDGCTSTCRNEVELWREQTPRGFPASRGMAVAYDAVRGELVAFGGNDGQTSNLSQATFVFRDGAWREVPTIVAPPRRWHAAIAYDPMRRRTILFGGFGENQQALGDTWAWDGIAWTLLAPASAPAARGHAAMTWDDARDQIVLYGGSAEFGIDAGQNFRDTWRWDGAAWTDAAPATTAGPRAGHAMAYDPRCSCVVLDGGRRNGNPYTSTEPTTWTWNGSTWSQRPTTARPRAVQGAVMAYDEARGAIVLFGGQTAVFADGAMDETWQLSATTWTQVTTTRTPAGRTIAGGAYDATRGTMVVVGGSGLNTGITYADTWELRGTRWTRLPTPIPDINQRGGMVYDRARGRLLLLGFSATWEWDGQAWSQRVQCLAGGDCPTEGAAFDPVNEEIIAYDGGTYRWTGEGWTPAMPIHEPDIVGGRMVTARDRVLLVGTLAGTDTPEMWSWDGEDWTNITTETMPPQREEFGLAFDRIRNRVVLYGGYDRDVQQPRGDHWEWDGTSWTEVVSAEGPGPRSGPVLVFFETLGRTVLFGGEGPQNVTNDTWEWDGTRWDRRAFLAAPPARHGGSGGFDVARGRLVITNGFGNGENIVDTWTYGYEAVDGTREQCVDGADFDGDQLAGCDDPDCWGRCTPLCPPGELCNPDDPRCGDGTCSLVEDYVICPADCAR